MPNKVKTITTRIMNGADEHNKEVMRFLDEKEAQNASGEAEVYIKMIRIVNQYASSYNLHTCIVWREVPVTILD